MPTIAIYVSGHGFGHAARVCEVLRALRRLSPDVACLVRSPLARWFFDFNLGFPIVYGACRLDVGVVQADSLAVDLPATCRAYAALEHDRERLIAAELAALRPHAPALVFADIPGLAFAVAERLGVPGVAMSNFSWDWIYADYVAELPAFAPLAAALRQDYGRATMLLRLPLYGDLGAFRHIRDIPLVARRAAVAPATTRRRLGLPPGDRLVLLSFGGLGLALDAAPRIAGVTFLATGASAAGDEAPAGVRAVTHPELTEAGLRYQDLVAACDAVLTKPGYGIVAECIANGTPMIYTARGRFAEYPCLVHGIDAHLPNAFIAPDDLRAGRWQAAVDAVLSQPRRTLTVRIDGADVAAAALASLAR